MNSKAFLKWGGIILVVIGILGFIGVVGPTAERSIFGAPWYFDNAENWAHLVLGVVALILAYAAGANVQRPIVMLLGIIGVVIGLYSLFAPITAGRAFLGAQLQNPLDSLLHIVVGLWALMAFRKKGGPMMATPGPSMP